MKKYHVFSLMILVMMFSCRNNQSENHDSSGMKDMAATDSFKKAHITPAAYNMGDHKGKSISFKVQGDQDGRGYLVENPGAHNYLLMFHEWWGLNDFTKHEADRLSDSLKVNVLAIDMFDGKVTSNPESASKQVENSDENRIKNIIKGAISYIDNSATEPNKGKFATVGWCFGGGWSFQASLMAPKNLAACVMYYGMPPQDKKELMPLKVPVLGLFAEKDKWINPKVVNQFDENLKSLGKEHKFYSFPADHAFANPSNPIYDSVSASKANALALDFLRNHLK